MGSFSKVASSAKCELFSTLAGDGSPAWCGMKGKALIKNDRHEWHERQKLLQLLFMCFPHRMLVQHLSRLHWGYIFSATLSGSMTMLSLSVSMVCRNRTTSV